MNKKKLGIILLIVAIAVLSVAILILLIPKEKESMNKVLSEDKIVDLLKRASLDLNTSDNLQEESIAMDSRAKFAVSYMFLDEEYSKNVVYDETNEIAIVNKEKLDEVVNYIFGANLKFNLLTCEFNKDTVYIPISFHGGDMQVYKFSKREYNEIQDYYITYIDCLESGKNRLTELANPNVIDYNEDEIIFTMIFKYKLIDGRKVLLSYDTISN